jgi:fermentation-respiration switch protein FrsA (DUF1100 family)
MADKVVTAVKSEGATLVTATGTLEGTLVFPTGEGPFPVALLISGSGPTDRDGNNAMLPGRNDGLRLLAEGLARGGIASLRYDKRGVGASAAAAPAEVEIRLETFIDDALAWFAWLKSDARCDRRAIIGHSEGSLIGMVAAQRGDAAAFVSLEGAGRTAQDTLMSQLSKQLPSPLLGEVQTVVDRLAKGQQVDPLPPALEQVPAVAALFRASVQPYLISWFKFDPATIIADLSLPVLVVQGSNDLQVSVTDARRLAGANPHARLAIIPGMNHVLKAAPADQAGNMATYSDPDLPLVAGLVTTLVTFLQGALSS